MSEPNMRRMPRREVAGIEGANDNNDDVNGRTSGVAHFPYTESSWTRMPMRQIVAKHLPNELTINRIGLCESSLPELSDVPPLRPQAAVVATTECEWHSGVLPILVSAIESATPLGVSTAMLGESCTHMLPSDTFAKVLAMTQGPAKRGRGPGENVMHEALRIEFQIFSDVTILPKSRQESDASFKLRLMTFKPQRRHQCGVSKHSSLVWPQQAHERLHDFEARMAAQSHTTFPLLPRRTGEAAADWDARLEAVREQSPFWHANAPHKTPPLVLPRGQHESDAVFRARLEQACAAPPQTSSAASLDRVCLVVMAQGAREEEAHATRRLAAQALTGETVMPFDPTLESEQAFDERLECVRAAAKAAEAAEIEAEAEKVRGALCILGVSGANLGAEVGGVEAEAPSVEAGTTSASCTGTHYSSDNIGDILQKQIGRRADSVPKLSRSSQGSSRSSSSSIGFHNLFGLKTLFSDSRSTLTSSSIGASTPREAV